MNILVIKTTSLGDVLHATPHLRAIRRKYPDAHLTVLTAKDSAEIYAHNPAIDRLVLFDRTQFKNLGVRSPRAQLALFRETLDRINDRNYDLAIDLQGLLRTVLYLYFTRASVKLVKGRWPGLGGFRDKQLHAIDEMTRVLEEADIPVADTRMEFFRAPEVADQLRKKLAAYGTDDKPGLKDFVVISPFTRWRSKTWPLERFIQVATELSAAHTVLITGTAGDSDAVDTEMRKARCDDRVVNLAGKLTLAELAELMSSAKLVISGDSFPMHLASAVGVPLIALFGPTDEQKTGPRTENSEVVRPEDCSRCDNPDCARACLNQIQVSEIKSRAHAMLELKSAFLN